MRGAALVTLLAGAVALAPRTATPVAAQERILSYDIEVAIRPDGALDVTERIRVRAEGIRIRRGIVRDFPTRYRDRFGNRVRVGFEVLGVERNGEPEPWFTEGRSNGIRINTGNDDFLPVPAEHEFTLRYRTTRQLGFFEDHDELYWNAIGTGWELPIETGSVVVTLPEPADPALLGAEGYTGYEGEQGQDYRASIPEPGVARYELTRGLAPFEGFTIVLTFPKGIVPEPTRSERVGWVLRDNRGVLVSLIGLVWLVLFTVGEWRRVGRDPPPGIVIPRYEPNPALTPGAHRYLRRMGWYDVRCFAGDILELAVAGHIRIHVEDRFVRKDLYTLERVAGATGEVSPAQRVLLNRLFAGGPKIRLEESNASTLQEARTAHSSSLDELLHPRYFRRNGKSIAKAFGIVAFTCVAAFLVSGGFGIPAIVVLTGAMIAILVVFWGLVRAPTPTGRAALDEIAGLELYLSVAEREELAAMRGPGASEAGPPRLDPERYERLLPYAVALEVEDAWTKKFTAAVGTEAAAAAASRIAWYSGSGSIRDLGSFSSAIGSSLSNSIAASSSPPGSSSGSGGGGSSGGGGGGGGGGGR